MELNPLRDRCYDLFTRANNGEPTCKAHMLWIAVAKLVERDYLSDTEMSDTLRSRPAWIVKIADLVIYLCSYAGVHNLNLNLPGIEDKPHAIYTSEKLFRGVVYSLHFEHDSELVGWTNGTHIRRAIKHCFSYVYGVIEDHNDPYGELLRVIDEKLVYDTQNTEWLGGTNG